MSRNDFPTAERGQPRAIPSDRPASLSGKVPALQSKALYRLAEAMELLSLGRTEFYAQIRRGRLRTVGQGRARRVPASAIAEYVALLEGEAA